MAPREEVVPQETRMGLGSEYDMQINWLPDAEIVEGELIVDPCWEEPVLALDGQGPRAARTRSPAGCCQLRPPVRRPGVREHRVHRRLAVVTRESYDRREVYIVEIKPRDQAEEIVRILRKRNTTSTYTSTGARPAPAMLEAEDYTDCARSPPRLPPAGMNLTPRSAHKIRETYQNRDRENRGIAIWCVFKREYDRGIATDKSPVPIRERPVHLRFARLLG